MSEFIVFSPLRAFGQCSINLFVRSNFDGGQSRKTERPFYSMAIPIQSIQRIFPFKRINFDFPRYTEVRFSSRICSSHAFPGGLYQARRPTRQLNAFQRY